MRLGLLKTSFRTSRVHRASDGTGALYSCIQVRMPDNGRMSFLFRWCCSGGKPRLNIRCLAGGERIEGGKIHGTWIAVQKYRRLGTDGQGVHVTAVTLSPRQGHVVDAVCHLQPPCLDVCKRQNM